jgi:hypothetical protein
MDIIFFSGWACSDCDIPKYSSREREFSFLEFFYVARFALSFDFYYRRYYGLEPFFGR